jgi:hypothetical protein
MTFADYEVFRLILRCDVYRLLSALDRPQETPRLSFISFHKSDAWLCVW